MNLMRNSSGELKIAGTNERMKRTLTTFEGRERLADLIVHGNGRVYTREEIKVRIQKVCARIVRKLA